MPQLLWSASGAVDLASVLGSIVENIPDMVFVKEAKELRFVLFNKAGEDLLGYPRETMYGKNDHDFFPPKEADFFTAKDRAVLESKTMLDIPEEPVHTKSRGTRILHTKKVPILGADGQPLYLLGISEDITEKLEYVELQKAKKELEDRNSEFERLFRTITDRELRMTELKAEIEKLRGTLGKS